MKKSVAAAILMLSGMATTPVLAQDVPEVVSSALVVGATIYGTDGAEVGKIEEMPGGNIVIFTGKNRATLPPSAFGMNETGLLIGMTKAQLDAAVEAAEAKATAAMDAALVPNAQVFSNDGVAVGSVKKIEGENVEVALLAGNAVTLQKQHFSTNDGKLMLFMSAAQFHAAVDAATQAGA